MQEPKCRLICLGLSVLLCLAGHGSAGAGQEEWNIADIASYAATVNRLAAENRIPAFVWECSEYVDRRTLTIPVPEYLDGIMSCYVSREDPGNMGDDAVFEEEDAWHAAALMTPGINLGNTLDATSFNQKEAQQGKLGWIPQWGAKGADGKVLPSAWETAWGQPVTTGEIADFMLAPGFQAVRIPVTWAEHLDERDRVDPAWMARVRQTVDLFYSRGVYVILNAHHDGGADGWLKAEEDAYRKYSGRFESLWKQIGETFADYDERLLFEGFNEMLDGESNWNTPDAEAMKWLNAWNQLFVDTVRSLGGHHLKRNLIVMTYAGNGSESSLAQFVLPADAVQGHLMVEVHNYDPQAFTWTNATWTRMTARWNEKTHGEILRRAFDVYRKYSDLWHVPFVLGEYNADMKKYADYD